MLAGARNPFVEEKLPGEIRISFHTSKDNFCSDSSDQGRPRPKETFSDKSSSGGLCCCRALQVHPRVGEGDQESYLPSSMLDRVREGFIFNIEVNSSQVQGLKKTILFLPFQFLTYSTYRLFGTVHLMNDDIQIFTNDT